jgi:hydrogenase nickel incorporation protein HypB
MCKECGCGIVGEVGIGGTPGGQVSSPLVHGHDHNQLHDHPHPHGHDHGTPPHTLALHQAILEKNDRVAERNRGFFKAKKLLVLNLVSSPGSGKTTLVQTTAEALKGRLRVGVIVGDLATDNDAARLRSAGVPVVQITTGTVCHLEADMVAKAMSQLPLDALDMLVIENVGNLVCPATYDLGEDLRVVLLSVTEGEDKPLKYPPVFHSADVAILNKIDLTAACEFDREKALGNLRRVSHHADVFELSARTGQGMDAWCDHLVQKHAAVRQRSET